MTNNFIKYIRVAAGTPNIKVADTAYNVKEILNLMKRAEEEEVNLLVLPELCITGYTCGDLFLQDTLLNAAEEALQLLVAESKNTIVVVGLPMRKNGKLYNMAAVFQKGSLMGFVPKSNIPNYGEFNELRYFTPGQDEVKTLFCCDDFSFAVEIGEDLWVPSPPSVSHGVAGAVVIANLSANCEIAGMAAKRRALVSEHSARTICGYVYANAGQGESTTDLVFSGHNLICENGEVLNESEPFGEGWALSEIDISALNYKRRRKNTFQGIDVGYTLKYFSMEASCRNLTRTIDPSPFIPKDKIEKAAKCEEILNIQAAGLKKRMEFAGSQTAVIAVSGGLDSTLALLVAERAAKEVVAITMPGFGTTERTRSNAHALCEALGIQCKEIDIKKSVSQHLKDINHESTTDIVYENAQARMRTYILMDVANQVNGIAVGPGNLSELALGWTTYSGDHMSMYAINSGIPKTLVRCVVEHLAEKGSPALSEILQDILATPISPELLPNQITEDSVGPYVLHDFFMYQMLEHGKGPTEIFQLACLAFDREADEILAWLKVFISRFFNQQFKRSCLPDGPKVGSISLSPRGDWKMPSDAMVNVWMKELENITTNVGK